MAALRLLAFLLGLVVVASTLNSAVRFFVLPRGVPDRVARQVFFLVRQLFNLRLRRSRSYAERDRVMALYGPYGLLALALVWVALVLLGYTLLYWALGVRPLRAAFTLSGSSLLTLGVMPPPDLPSTVLAFSEGTFGLILIALLITYLPTIYGAFQRREQAVTLLEVRAGSPPSAVEMLVRFHRIEQLHRLTEEWVRWEAWFADIEESHTSLAAINFFRSPQPDHSWVTAAGAVLDAASLASSTVDTPRDPQAELCIRAGYLALRRIAAFFRAPYDPDPAPSDPISVTREEYDEACDRLAGAGVPLKPDRDRAWRDFAGWRVNYDAVLIALAELTMAPPAPWSSDRARTDAPASPRLAKR